MTEHDKARFAAIMAAMAEIYGKELSAPALGLHFRLLREYAFEEVERAALTILKSRKYTSMPTPADFIEHISGGSVDDRAEVEAGKVLRAIATIGGYRSVVFDDPVTQAVIGQTYGGWARLCRESSLRHEKWWRREFVRAYASYARQRVVLHGHLPGLTEIENTASGRPDAIPHPVPVGDPERAAAVLAAAHEGAGRADTPLGATPGPARGMIEQLARHCRHTEGTHDGTGRFAGLGRD